MTPAIGLLGLLISVIPVVLFVLGIVFVVLGIRGRPILAEPTCMACGFDLRNPEGKWERCPECGVSLDGGRKVRFARHVRRPKMIVWGAVLGLVGPAVVVGGLRAFVVVQQRRSVQQTIATGVGVNPFQLRTMTSEEVAAALPANIDQPWVWQELESRRGQGTIDDASVRAALLAVVETLETPGATRPVQGLTWGREAIDAWRTAGIIDETLDQRLMAAATTINVKLPSRVRVGEDVTFEIRADGPPGAAGDVLVALEAVRNPDGAGREVTYPESRHRGGRVGNRFRSVAGSFPVDLPPGEHAIEFDLVLGLVDPVAATAFRTAPPTTVDDWPADMPRATRTVVATLVVVPDEDPLVDTTTDPSHLRDVRATLEPLGVSAVPMPQGRVQVTVVMDRMRRKTLPVPIVARIFVTAGDERWSVGEIGMARNRSYSGGESFTTTDFDRSIETVDVIFVMAPDVAAEREFAEYAPIWGEDVVFENIPVRWFGDGP